MVHFATNPISSANDVSVRREQSGAAKSADAARGAGSFGEEIIQHLRSKLTGGSQMRAAQRMEGCLRYMIQHLNRPMKVSVLSAMTGLSESSFFSAFKAATGLTPLDFFTRARMHRAGELLLGTSLQINEVAVLVGYEDQFYFSRVFKSVHGVPPRDYRARNGQKGSQALPMEVNVTGRAQGGLLPDQQPVRYDKTAIRNQALIAAFSQTQPAQQATPAVPTGTRTAALNHAARL